MYTGLEFFMGTIVQLADLMEAATWMTTSCTATRWLQIAKTRQKLDF